MAEPLSDKSDNDLRGVHLWDVDTIEYKFIICTLFIKFELPGMTQRIKSMNKDNFEEFGHQANSSHKITHYIITLNILHSSNKNCRNSQKRKRYQILYVHVLYVLYICTIYMYYMY